jgi:hypothetical protein
VFRPVETAYPNPSFNALINNKNKYDAKVLLLLTYSGMRLSMAVMKKYMLGISKRLVAAALVIVAVVAVSALTMQTSPRSQNSIAFKSIQTNKATLFYSDTRAARGGWFVEMVLPGTGESKAATENLKSVVATL